MFVAIAGLLAASTASAQIEIDMGRVQFAPGAAPQEKPAPAPAAAEGARPGGTFGLDEGAVDLTGELNAEPVKLIQRAQRNFDAGETDRAIERMILAAEKFGERTIQGPDGRLQAVGRVIAGRLLAWDAERPGVIESYRNAVADEVAARLGKPIERIDDADRLRAVTTRHPLSAAGDEAALKLASILIDRGRFAMAATLLRGVDRDYPDPTVDRRGLALRLALAYGRAGATGARDAVLDRLAEGGLDPRTIARVREAAQPRGRSAGDERGRAGAGGPQAPPRVTDGSEGLAGDGWSALWTYRFDADLTSVGVSLKSGFNKLKSKLWSSSDAQRVARWRRHRWRPTIEPVGGAGAIFFAAGNTFHGIDALTGRAKWPAVTNTRLDRPLVAGPANKISSEDGRTEPAGYTEFIRFGDRTLTAVAVDDRTAYYIEIILEYEGLGGDTFALFEGYVGVRSGYTASRLVAVDRESGAVKWRRAFGSGPQGVVGQSTPTRIVAPPRLLDDRLLTVYEDGDRLFLAAVDRSDGRVLYRRTICVADPLASPRWPRVGLAVDSGTAFINTNRGLLVAVDVDDGLLQWATRYPRLKIETPPPGISRRTFDWAVERTWEDARVIPVDARLIVVAPDATGLLVFDRFGGALVRQIEQLDGIDLAEFEYIAAAAPERLVMGGGSAIAAVRWSELIRDVSGADEPRRIEWYVDFVEGAFGRAAFADRRVYVPTGKGVLELDAGNGRRLALNPVDRAGDEPLGNLFIVDGRLFAATGGDVTALGEAGRQLERLDRMVDQGDAEALAARASLLARRGRLDTALADLRREVALRGEGPGVEGAIDRLVEQLAKAAEQSPERADALFGEAIDRAPDETTRLSLRLRLAELKRETEGLDAAIERLHGLAMLERPSLVRREEAASGSIRIDRFGLSKLREALGELEADEALARLEKLGRPVLEAALAAAPAEGAPPRWERFHRIATVHAGTSVAADAIAALAEMLADPERFTPVESVLQELSLRQPPATAALARVKLGEAYAERGWRREALAAFRGALLALEQAPETAEGERRLAPGRDALGRRVAALAEAIDAERRGVPSELAWEVESDGARLLRFVSQDTAYRSGRSPRTGRLGGVAAVRGGYLERHALVYRPSESDLTAYAVRDGKPAWTAQLPGDIRSPDAAGDPEAAGGGIDGHIVMLATPTEAVAIDATTGERLWTASRNLAPITPAFPTGWSLIDFFLEARAVVGPGFYAEIVDETKEIGQTLVVRDARSGAILWKRGFGPRFIQSVGVLDHDRIGVIIEGEQRAVVLDATTGRQAHRFPIVVRGKAYRSWTPHGLLTIDRNGTVYLQSGESGGGTWQHRAPDPATIMAAAQLDRDRLAIGWTKQQVSVLDLAERRALAEGDCRTIHPYNMGLSADGQTLAVVGKNGSRFSSPMALARMDLKNGKVSDPVEFGPLTKTAYNGALFAHFDPLMPLLVQQEVQTRFKLRFVDVKAGRPLENQTVTVPPAIDRPRLRNGAVLITTRGGVHAVKPAE